MDIVFAFDERYADHVFVPIESLVTSLPAGVSHRLWIATTASATREIQQGVQRQVAGRGASAHFLTVDERFRVLGRSTLPGLSYISSGAHLRLFLPSLLPSSVERFVYLDSDVLIEGDLQPLATLDLRGHPVAAVRDLFTPTLGAQGGLPGCPASNDTSAAYFNAGVLLVDRVAWSQREITERCIGYLERNRGILRFPDQDALNLACYDSWRRLDDRWNYQGWWPDPGQVEMRPPDLRITHYLGRRKPWDNDFPLDLHREKYRQWEAQAARARSRSLTDVRAGDL